VFDLHLHFADFVYWMFISNSFLFLEISDLGRTASHFYIKHATVEVFNGLMEEIMTEADVLSMISQSQEFEQLKVSNHLIYIISKCW
jgi:replicative superfamily II helicase